MLHGNSADVLSFLLSYQLDNNIEGSLAEIGVYHGKVFCGLIYASRINENVVGAELFPQGVEQGLIKNISTIPANLRTRVKIFAGDSKMLTLEKWAIALEKPARFIHIDGGHNRNCILNDLFLSTSFISNESLIVIDDYLHEFYPDVTEAVNHYLLANNRLDPVAIIPVPSKQEFKSKTGLGGNKLICAPSVFAQKYRKVLVEKYKDFLPRKSMLCFKDVLTFQGF